MLEPGGFALCGKCYRWLMSDGKLDKHVYTSNSQGDCPQKATPEDIISRLEIHTTLMTAVLEFDVLLPDDVAAEDSFSFYVTLQNALLQSIALALDLEDREIAGFVVHDPEDERQHRIMIYETEEGGAGALASLIELPRMRILLRQARELLHEGDPDGGCEKACYDCLCTFYNQRYHEVFDRHLVLPWLQGLDDLEIESQDRLDDEAHFQALLRQCESSLEREVLEAIRDAGLRLPDEAQRTIYIDDIPVAEADFFYQPRIIVFVDGSPHHLDYVQAADEEKRSKLRNKGYYVAVIRPESMDEDLETLSKII